MSTLNIQVMGITFMLACLCIILFCIVMILNRIYVEVSKIRLHNDIANEWKHIKKAEEVGLDIEEFYKKK